MKIEQCRWSMATGWEPAAPGRLGAKAQLVLFFGDSALLASGAGFQALRAAYPQAYLFGCSTAGEICGTRVFDGSLVATAVQFDSTEVRGATVSVEELQCSYRAGEELAAVLAGEGLRHVLVLSDGLAVNGSELVRGLTETLPVNVAITGGLSGDGERFAETLVAGDSPPRQHAVAAVGLYGNQLRVGYASLGGWDPFRPERLITRSNGNVLYEMDGKSALRLYKTYLGEHAGQLPASGLLFPLALRSDEGTAAVVRTILAVSEEEQSMTFAGDVPEGAYARLMRANFDRLIDGAVGAARTSHEAVGLVSPELAILISCVGRKMVLGQRIEEEVEGVREVLGEETALTGFYSYGEISPFTPNARCELHNQTMTITTLAER